MQTFTVRNEGQQPHKKNGCLRAVIIGILLYIGLSAFIGYWMGDMLSTSVATIENNTVYRLQMRGSLVEQAQEQNPMLMIMGEQDASAVGLDELLSNIRLAATDERIHGIYLEGGTLAMQPASAKALRDALIQFKQSGKWIIAYASYYSTSNYYVASVADRIYLNPVGNIAWNGLTAQKLYLTRLYEKIGIEMQILKVGTFKSAVEPYFRTSMSEEDRLQTKRYLDGIWEEMRTAVSLSRDITPDLLDDYANDCMELQPAETFVQYGLADSLVYAEAMDSILRVYSGTRHYHLMSTNQLSTVERPASKAKRKIAVVYASGDIITGNGEGISDKQMHKIFKKIRKDPSIDAVVLRVNSPGGSADASEQIWNSIQATKETNRPIVVSMGDYAASGGYYISCGADYIFAEPTTLTGSIGIFGLIPNWGGLRDKIGIDIDGVSTHQHADIWANMVYRGMNEEEQQLMQEHINRGYDLFTKRCAEGRHMTQDDIKTIAEGRVWLGKDAVKLGLVDSLGNLNDAIAKAVELIGAEQYQIVYYPEKKDPMEQFLNAFNLTSEEEELIRQIRQFASKPQIMTRMQTVDIQ